MSAELSSAIRALSHNIPQTHAQSFSSTSALENLRKSAFLELKPKCVTISQLVLTAHLNPKLVSDLTAALVSLHESLVSTVKRDPLAISKGLGDYIFFPLSHVFREQGKYTDRILELTLQCVLVLVETCWSTDVEKDLAKQLIILITFIIGGKPGVTAQRKASEETQTSGCRCLKTLFVSLNKGFLEEVEMLPAVGHCATTLLDCLRQATGLELQVVSVEALDTLVKCVTDEDVLASFFPGIVSTMSKVLDPRTSGQRKGKSMSASLGFLGRVVARVLDDVKTSQLMEDTTVASVETKDSSLKTIRTAAWVKATAGQVNVALVGVLRLRTHRLLSVRKALFELCRNLLQFCPVSMKVTIPQLIETIVIFSTDADDDLAEKSERSVKSLVGANKEISEALQMGLHGWIISLPRNLQSQDEDKKARLLRQISMSFKILGELGMDSEVLQDAVSQNLRDGILGITAPKNDQNVEAVAANAATMSMELVNTGDQTGTTAFPDIVMAHKSQIDTITRTRALLEMLGQSNSSIVLAQRHIREASYGSAESRSTSLWIAINIIRGSIKKEDDWLVDSSTTLIERRVVDELYSVALSSLLETYDDTKASTAANCMALEAISVSAEYMKADFKFELVEALYPVVHLLGSSSAITQTHAIICLNNLARFCGYSSTKELLLDNVDYMVNAVSLKLNMFDISPQAPTVLLMMIRLAGPSLMPYLDDLVVSIFAALDNFHGYQRLTGLLFEVLRGIVDESVKGGRGQFMITQSGEAEMTVKNAQRSLRIKKELAIEDLLKDLEIFDDNRKRLEPLPAPKPVVEDADESEETPHKPWVKDKDLPPSPFADEDENSDPPPPSQEVVKPPALYTMLQSITKLSQYYLTHSSPTLRTQLLQIITTASPFLSLNEDEFLPLVHQLWPVVIDRLSDSEPHVIIASISTITQLCRDCGDFLSSRINEAWQVMKKVFLGVQRMVDRERAAGKVVTYALDYRIWEGMLWMFEVMVECTRLEERIVHEVLGLVIGYVEDKGREGLKGAFGETEMDSMWLELEGRNGGVGLNLPQPVTVEGAGGVEMLHFRKVVF